MANVADIEGVGEVLAAKLTAAGAGTVEKLLELGAKPAGRADLAEKVGVTAQRILEWVNRADLARIKGIGSEYADLLEAAGVDSVPELAQRNAENLQAKLVEVDAAKKLVRRVPTLAEVTGWIDQAKDLPRAVFS